MAGNTMAVRAAIPKDAVHIARIYNDEVLAGTTNYEVNEHTDTQRVAWLEELHRRDYPVMVAEVDGRVAGFAAITPFHSVSGYRFTGTGSIYIDRAHRRSGVGHALGVAMIAEARRRRFHTLIGGVNAENAASLALLESFGFERVGYFKQIGRKGGRWLDDVCLQLILESNDKEER